MRPSDEPITVADIESDIVTAEKAAWLRAHRRRMLVIVVVIAVLAALVASAFAPTL